MTKKAILSSLLKVIWYFFLACILFFFGILVLDSITGPKVQKTKDLYFSFHPQTVLESIRQNKLEQAFILQSEDFEPNFDAQSSPVKWEQIDFLQIAQVLHKNIIGGSLGDWSLQSVIAGVDCKKIDSGPQYVEFAFYETTKNLLQTTRYTEEITIDASANFIRIKTETISPVWNQKKSIDLHEININANDALRLAEDHKGREVRKGVENDCTVSASLIPDIGIENWEVRYFNRDNARLFRIVIDKMSGEYNITHQ